MTDRTELEFLCRESGLAFKAKKPDRLSGLRTIITILVLGVGSSLLGNGCNSLPADSGFVQGITPTVTSILTPTSTLTVTPTETITFTATPTRTPDPTPTPTPDLRVLNPANQHFYLFVREGKTWHEAKDYCAALGGHLVTIARPSENLFVYNLSSDNALRGIWLGATDEVEEGKWVWVTGEPWDYRNWEVSRWQTQPDNQNGSDSSGANYLLLIWDKTWYDVTDGNFPYFVCEWEPAST